MRGVFITLEGPDGTGKTTQLELLQAYFTQIGLDVLFTREPGGTPIGDKIRKLLLDPQNVELGPITEVLLFAASRAQLIGQVIEPALAAGRIVVCDRYLDATLAYQGAGRGLDEEMLRQINAHATKGLRPDRTILFDLPPEHSLSRTGGDRIEQEGLEFHRRVRTGFSRIAQHEPDRVKVVLVDAGIEEIHQRVLTLIEPLVAPFRVG